MIAQGKGGGKGDGLIGWSQIFSEQDFMKKIGFKGRGEPATFFVI